MTDVELVEKRLAFIERCLRELREEARPELVETDLRERRFVEHTLQIAIQAALDVASHVIAARRLAEPTTNRQMFERLVGDGWLDAELGTQLGRMAGFRNILVHGYTEVDPSIVGDVCRNRLGDLDRFVVAIRARLGGS